MKWWRGIGDWRVLAALYVLVMLFFGGLFYLVPDAIPKKNHDFLTCFYFSAITITTVGYGDVVPNSNAGKVLAILEAVSGIIILGLFLNSFWQARVEWIAAEQKMNLDAQEKLKNRKKIKSYYAYASHVLHAFILCIVEVVTPIEKRQNVTFKANPDFKFSDLRDMYKPSMLIEKGITKSVLRIYFEKKADVVAEFKFLLAHFDFADYPDLYRAIVQFLIVSEGQDNNSALLAYETTMAGDKTLAQMVEETLRKTEEMPDRNLSAINLMAPIITLYDVLKIQVPLIRIIESVLDSISQDVQ